MSYLKYLFNHWKCSYNLLMCYIKCTLLQDYLPLMSIRMVPFHPGSLSMSAYNNEKTFFYHIRKITHFENYTNKGPWMFSQLNCKERSFWCNLNNILESCVIFVFYLIFNSWNICCPYRKRILIEWHWIIYCLVVWNWLLSHTLKMMSILPFEFGFADFFCITSI